MVAPRFPAGLSHRWIVVRNGLGAKGYKPMVGYREVIRAHAIEYLVGVSIRPFSL